MFKEHAACLGIQQPQVSTDVFMFKPKFKLSLYWEASATWLYLIILALNAKKKNNNYVGLTYMEVVLSQLPQL